MDAKNSRSARWCGPARYLPDEQPQGGRRRLDRRRFFAWAWFLAGGFALPGCANSWLRGTKPGLDELDGPDADGKDPTDVETVGDLTRPFGVLGQKVESIALVTGLAGTGSDPPPGPQRQLLIDEMQTRNVESPNQLLASPSTSLVLVRAVLPPGVRKGDRVDIQVQVPSRSETTSLRSGWLMQCRLREMENLGGQVRPGHIIALGEGRLLVEAAFQDKAAKALETRGFIPGGAISHTERSLGLVVRDDSGKTVRKSALIATAINSRFHAADAAGGRTTVANAKRDDFIELQLHPRYALNFKRYIRIVQNVALKEKPARRRLRIELLAAKLREPVSTEAAAWQLEAIGKEAIPTLKQGLASADLEVRFNAAEALAYLDVPEAAPALAEAARESSAFRWSALMALAGMGPDAFDALSELLHVPSVETRYGAFRALSHRRQISPLVRGVVLGDEEFSFHVVQSQAPPVIHFARTRRPELVLFGADQKLQPPNHLFLNKQVLVKRVDDDNLKITRFEPGKENREETVSNVLAQFIPVAVRLGVGYLDLLAAFRQAKADGWLDSRVAVEALPRPGRSYQRPGSQGERAAGTIDDAEADSPMSDANASIDENGSLENTGLENGGLENGGLDDGGLENGLDANDFPSAVSTGLSDRDPATAGTRPTSAGKRGQTNGTRGAAVRGTMSDDGDSDGELGSDSDGRAANDQPAKLARPDIFERDRRRIEPIDRSVDKPSAWDRFLERWIGIKTE
jgi:hypothetical protein